MIEEGIAQFQNLSRCEAAHMCQAITSAILYAYEVGFNVAANNYDKGLDDLFNAHKKGLEDIGFSDLSFSDAMEMISLKVEDKP